MSDLGLTQPFQPPQAPVQEASLAEGFQALGTDDAQQAQPTVTAQPLVANPVPVVPPQVAAVGDITTGWHADPLKQGMADGFVNNYARQMPGGLPQAAQHLNTVRNLVDTGQLEESKLWTKFQNNPERMTADESAQLAEQIRTIGNATQESPDLRFDPVGRVDRVRPDGSVRINYRAAPRSSDLDLRTLAPSGLDNLRRMATIGQGATKPATALDALPAFLGLNRVDRPSKENLADLNDTVNVLAREMQMDPGTVLAAVAAGWESIAPQTEPWKAPWASTSAGPNPAAEALDDRLSSRLVAAMGQGVTSVDFTGGKALSVTVDPVGGLSVSAAPTVRNAKMLRHLYPAFAKDGATAWLPSVPAKTADVTKLAGNTSVYNGPIMDQLGGHPGMVPGDHVVFDAPARFQSPGPADSFGPVLSTQPELQLDRVAPNEIDPEQFTGADSPLHTHAWAIIPGGNETKVALTRKGFKPIPHTIGDRAHQLVFGISPAEARKVTDGEIVTNKGVWSADGFREGDGVSFDNTDDGDASTTHLLTGDVHWFLDGVDRGAEPDDNASWDIEQTQVSTERKRVKVDDPSTLTATVAQLRQAGAQNLRVYSHRAKLDGFKPAYEHVFTDGQNYATHLSPTPSAEGHVIPVFVPERSHVPVPPEQAPSVRQGTAGVQLNGVSVLSPEPITKLTELKQQYLGSDGDALVPSDNEGPVQLVRGRLKVTDPSPESASVLRLAKLAGMPADRIDAPLPDKLDHDRPMSVTISGAQVPALRRTRPNPSWEGMHGVEFDPSYRSGGTIETLPDRVQFALSNTFGDYTGQYPGAHQMWAVPRVAMTHDYTDAPAYTEWGRLGGAIGLSVAHYANPDELAAKMAGLAKSGVIAANMTANPLRMVAYPFAHELGHTVHGALQFGSDGTGAKAELLALRKRLGLDGIRAGLSKQAVHSPEEMVAEAVAQGLTGKPGKVAQDVLAIVNNALTTTLNTRTKAPW